MNLDRDLKRKRLQIQIEILNRQIEKATKRLSRDLKRAEADLKDLDQLGFRVTFDRPYGVYGTHTDFFTSGSISLQLASRLAEGLIFDGARVGVNSIKIDLFKDML